MNRFLYLLWLLCENLNKTTSSCNLILTQCNLHGYRGKGSLIAHMSVDYPSKLLGRPPDGSTSITLELITVDMTPTYRTFEDFSTAFILIPVQLDTLYCIQINVLEAVPGSES